MENSNHVEGQKCLLDVGSNSLYLGIIFSNFNRNLQIIQSNSQKYNLNNVTNLSVILYMILVFSTVNSSTSLGKENIYYPHAYQPAYERAYEPPQYEYDDHKAKHYYPDSHYYLLYYLYYFWHWFWSNIVNNIILIIIVWFLFRLYYRNRFT
jgi:hypothetical protein